MKDISVECEPNAEGWLWPKSDQHTWRWVVEDEGDIPDWVMSFVPQKRCCVQAGGNCGYYVAKYAERFISVLTFEPHPLNFRCLVSNVARENVYFFRAALGGEASLTAIRSEPTHLGGCQVDLRSAGLIPMLTLDSLDLLSVDLIHLDIEGFELAALGGMLATIRRCRPVIAVEVNERGGDFGHTYGTVLSFFAGIGYRHGGAHRSEHVFLPDPETPVT